MRKLIILNKFIFIKKTFSISDNEKGFLLSRILLKVTYTTHGQLTTIHQLEADSMAAYVLMSCLTVGIVYELVDMFDAPLK